MSFSIPLQIAETIQTASINRTPSPAHDLNPSTSASSKQPVTVSRHGPGSESSLEKYASEAGDDIEEEDEDEDGEDVPYTVVRPAPRRGSFGPLPDLRFEQSYLASIAGADTRWRVAYITVRDQILLPLLQGMVWSLALHGWRYWNRNAQLTGVTIGARIRRWWYRTNNWPISDSLTDLGRNERLATDMSEYYQNQSSGGD